ncbi:glycoside hydrolase family 2 TIM barrel-domain containing protein [Oligoflexus tunisiensis]|uniref:glycoside hydrolase family 2 TIM barrel-domain containing protein n=1 Tax=Oligoflexus tunisiensis TaxID=708132 RepID=UPI001C40542A|nr:glycoside hydrolase family 2 TIM barrel-domain containing protein [Oligoflexus tunisiensis]
MSKRSPSGSAPEPEPPLGVTEPQPDPETGGRSDVEVIPVVDQESLRLQGRQLLVNGRPMTMRAVCWNPVRPGGQHPEGLIFRNPSAADLLQIEQDFQMMKALGVNTIRTYEPILDDRVLALVQKHQLHMIVPVFHYFATDMVEVISRVQKLKNHPGTLLWEIGNEWNYNQFYSVGTSTPLGMDAAKSLVKKVISTIRGVDQRLPIATVHGELPSRELIEELSGIDIWGLNIYSGLSFGTRFQTWRTLTDKPMYLGEYGADAMNRTVVDEASQSKAVVALTQEIEQHLSSRSADNVSIGGAVFEWNDEWWKDKQGSADRQDPGGSAPGSGPYPDNVFNEEWWGLVTIDRKPRPVYQELKKLWKPIAEETF